MATLGAMFANTGVKKAETPPQRVTKWIHYTKLKDNAAQYCNERDKDEIIALAGLIDADNGVLQQILVRKIKNDQYEIIAGHKRRRACKYLVEEEGKKQYAFVPCFVENISDVKAEFQLYSSNSHHVKTDYEKMHELERMKYLVETYPEEFPHLQTGRMVERLAAEMKIKKTTVGEYLTISKNLGENARTAFEDGTIKKSAAVEMATLPEKEQDALLSAGVTALKDIKAYKEEYLEPSEEDIRLFYEHYIQNHDKNRAELKEYLIRSYGKRHSCGTGGAIDFDCSPKGIKLGKSKEISWTKFINKINEYYPVHKKEETIREKEKITDAKCINVPDFGTRNETENIIPGQLCVTDVDMNVEEDIPVEDKEEYTPKYFLNEQIEKLEKMEKAAALAPTVIRSTIKPLERQRMIVKALTAFSANTETANIKEKTVKLMQPELPTFHNTEERRVWLENYKDWGVWYTDNRIGVTYYKYEFPNKTVLIAEEYKSDYSKYGNAFFHLVGGPKKREKNSYGVPRYPYHERYCRHSDSITELIEFLKAIQK
jgi:putative uncharacterized protein (fragment)